VTEQAATAEGRSLVVTSISELVTNDPDGDAAFGVLHDAAVAIVDGVVDWVGPSTALPDHFGDYTTLDAGGRCVVPGFVDAHTHTVFAGDRAGEFARRLTGATYEEILASGGGIYSTVDATRSASFVDLMDQAMVRFRRMLGSGSTTIEVKSGYGLTVESEVAMIAAARAIDMALPSDVVSTFLGAHVVAPEFRDDRDGYLDLVTGPMLDAVAGDVSFVDVFCDAAAFTVEEARRVCEAAYRAELGFRIHADQTARIGATALAAEVGAASADHLDHANDDDLEQLAAAGTVAVLLPGVSFSMRTRPPDGRRVWDSGARVAIATDCNPGTAYVETMPFMIALAVIQGGLTPGEAVWAATRGGALALGLDDRGALLPGAAGDLVILDAPTHIHLAYKPDAAIVARVVKAGVVVA
jgi:imidazolonepropionase